MILDCAVYEAGRRRDGPLALEDAFEAAGAPDAFAWIGLYEPTEEELDAVAREFGLHELAVEDAVKAHQRPKLEVYDETIFIVLKTARYLDEPEEIELGEILVFAGEGFIVTVRHGEASALGDVRKRLEERPDLLRCGPGAALHAIIDKIVDDYEPVVNGLEDDVEEVETEVFAPRAKASTERIYKLKRETILMHRVTDPLIEPLRRLTSGQLPQIHPDVREYYRDVYDHVVRAVERVDGMRDLLTSVLEANLTQVSIRQNDDMRKISAWAAIAAIPTVVGSWFGMNFHNLPGLDWEPGWALTGGGVLVACVALYVNFRRINWL